MFASKYCKIFKNTYFEEHLRQTASGDLHKFGFLGKVQTKTSAA